LVVQVKGRRCAPDEPAPAAVAQTEPRSTLLLMSFSERYGYKPVRSVLQREAMDDPLRISLWNVLELYFWASLRDAYTNPGNRSLADAIWLHHFKWTL